MAAAAAIGVGGSVAGGIIGSNAANKAASQQTAAQQQALNWIEQTYGQTQGNLQPNISAGQGALGSLLGFYGLPGGNTAGAAQNFQQFQNTPFYQFPLQQANLATNRALAASGQIGSGGALRDLSKLNSGYASQGLGQYLSGLGGLVSGGQQAATSLGDIGQHTGQNVGQAYTNIGNAQAMGTYNAAGSWEQAIQNSLKALGTSQATPGQGSSSYGQGGFMSGGGGMGGGGSIGSLGGMY